MLSFQQVLALGVLGSTLVFPAQAILGATTNATCTTDLWTFNELQQSPCLVAAVLQGVCNGGTWSLPSILPGQAYGGPKEGESNVCQCSTVVYSMTAACASCQGAIVDPWTNWKTNCLSKDISVSSFPLSIPSIAAVPSWAYLNVSGTWNAISAFNVHNSDAPDSSAGQPSSTPTSLIPTSSSTTSVTSSSHASHKGAIAGGVIGGIIGLVVLGLAVFIILRHRGNRENYPSRARLPNGEKIDLIGPRSPPPQETPVPSSVMQSPPKLYDPDDPSTFPPEMPLPPSVPPPYHSR